MPKRLVTLLKSVLISAMLMLTLSGCWNYKSLDEINIVIGTAIDYDFAEDLFAINYEVADLASSEKQGSIGGRVFQEKGKNLFDTARRTNRRESDRLFFGSAQVLILSEDVAKEIGIMRAIEWFLRDSECRESMCIAISQEETAGELLQNPVDMKAINSATLYDIIVEDQQLIGTTPNTTLYRLYDDLRSTKRSAALPALRQSEDQQGNKFTESNGTAIIKGDQLAGYLTPDQSRYLLLVQNQLQSTIFTLSVAENYENDVSLEVFINDAKMSYEYKDGKFTFKFQTLTRVAIGENQGELDVLQESIVTRIEKMAEQKIQEGIKDMVETLQKEFGADVLGFSGMINKKDLNLWREIEASWDEIYPQIEVEVSSKVHVVNAASIK